MLDGFLLFGAFAATLAGMGWLALTLSAHWKQVCDSDLPSARSLAILRSLGGAALLVSLLLCLKVDHASMASLVWVMLLGVSAITLAFTLTLRPRWLRILSLVACAGKLK